MSDAGINKGLVAAALRKLREGSRPTREEQAALRAYEKAREERQRWEHYRNVPQKDYRAMSGRQTKILHDQAALHGIPVGQPVIDLTAVVRWIHDFLGKNARKLAALDGDDPLMAGGEHESLGMRRWLEEYRKWRSQRERLQVEQIERNLVPVAVVREGLTRLAGLLRRAGERLGRRFGEEAQTLLNETLDEFDRELEAWHAEEGPC